MPADEPRPVRDLLALTPAERRMVEECRAQIDRALAADAGTTCLLWLERVQEELARITRAAWWRTQ